MPAYDYQCQKCGHEFEQFAKISSRNEPCEKPCPQCGEMEIKQKIGAPAFSYSGAKMPTNTKLREKFQQIHENTPGSRLDQVSTMTKI